MHKRQTTKLENKIVQKEPNNSNNIKKKCIKKYIKIIKIRHKDASIKKDDQR